MAVVVVGGVKENFGPLLLVLIGLLLATMAGTTLAQWDIRYHLGTKTPYWPQQDSGSYTPPPAGCRPVHYNLVARHGSRQPSDGDIEAFSKFHSILEKYYDAMDAYPWMRNWTNPFDLEDANLLTIQGEFEHYEMAQRTLAFYKELLDEYSFEPSRYEIRSTAISRAGQSADAYSFGLFQGRGQVGQAHFDPVFIVTNDPKTDYELRFFDTCPTYTKDVKDNKSSKEQSSIYKLQHLPQLAEKLTKRIDISEWTLTVDEVETLWTLCTFQISAQNLTDEFCSFFDEEDVTVMNFMSDLAAYWQKGYGYPINYEIACPLLKNIMNTIRTVIKRPVDQHSLRASLRFAHAETIMPLLSIIGLFKDSVPLTANFTDQQISNRLWRQSFISPFAANVAFVTYNCSKAGAPPDYRIKLFHNEKEYQIPQCEQLYCPVERFNEIYSSALSCNFTSLCDIQSCPSGNDDDDDIESLMSHKATIILVVCVGVGGFLAGVLSLGFVLTLIRCLRRRHQDLGYELAADAVIL